MASQSDPVQYDLLVETLAELRERSRRVVENARTARPTLVLVYGEQSGPSRKAESFLAQVLQRRHNHDTFRLVRVNAEKQPELVERLRVKALPTLLVVDGRRVRARIEMPRGKAVIERALSPWLR